MLKTQQQHTFRKFLGGGKTLHTKILLLKIIKDNYILATYTI